MNEIKELQEKIKKRYAGAKANKINRG